MLASKDSVESTKVSGQMLGDLDRAIAIESVHNEPTLLKIRLLLLKAKVCEHRQHNLKAALSIYGKCLEAIDQVSETDRVLL